MIFSAIKKIENTKNIIMFKDKIIKCKDCGKTFVFTAKEQEKFNNKGWSDPIRCPECRSKKHKNLEKLSEINKMFDSMSSSKYSSKRKENRHKKSKKYDYSIDYSYFNQLYN